MLFTRTIRSITSLPRPFTPSFSSPIMSSMTFPQPSPLRPMPTTHPPFHNHSFLLITCHPLLSSSLLCSSFNPQCSSQPNPWSFIIPSPPFCVILSNLQTPVSPSLFAPSMCFFFFASMMISFKGYFHPISPSLESRERNGKQEMNKGSTTM